MAQTQEIKDFIAWLEQRGDENDKQIAEMLRENMILPKDIALETEELYKEFKKI